MNGNVARISWDNLSSEKNPNCTDREVLGVSHERMGKKEAREINTCQREKAKGGVWLPLAR